MGGRWRKRRVAKWMGVCACALILAAWGVSEFWQVETRCADFAIWTMDGVIGVTNLLGVWRAGFLPDRLNPLGDYDRSFGFGLPFFESYDGRSFLRLPYWCLLVLAGVPTALLFYLDRRKILPGHCNQCGYDLRTLTSGRCPECGLAPAAKG